MILENIYQKIIFVDSVSKVITHLIVFLIHLIIVKYALKKKISFVMEGIYYIQRKAIGDMKNLQHLLSVQMKFLVLVEHIMMMFNRKNSIQIFVTSHSYY